MVPLWQRPKKDVQQEEYDRFYQDKFGDYQAPLATIKVDAEKAQNWIKNGAQPTDTVRALLKKANVL